MKKNTMIKLFYAILASLIMVGINPVYAEENTSNHNKVMSVKEAQAISESTLVSIIQKELNDYKSQIETQNQAPKLNGIEKGSLDVTSIEYTKNGISASMDFHVYDSVDYEKSLAMNASGFNTSLDTFSDTSQVIVLGKAKIYDTNTHNDVSALYPIRLKRDTYRVGSEQRVIFQTSGTNLQVGVSVNIFDTMVENYGVIMSRFQGTLEELKTAQDIVSSSSLQVYDEDTLINLDNVSMNQTLKVGLNQEVTIHIPEINLDVPVYGDIYDVKTDTQGIVGHDFISIYDENISQSDLIALAGVESRDIQSSNKCTISLVDYSGIQKGKNTLTFKACDAELTVSGYFYDAIDNVMGLGFNYEPGYLQMNQANYQDSFKTEVYTLATGLRHEGSISYDVPQTLGLNQWSVVKINNTVSSVKIPTHRYRTIEENVGILGDDVITTQDILKDKNAFESKFSVEAYQLPHNTSIASRNISIQNYKELGVGLNQEVLLNVKGVSDPVVFHADIYQDIQGNKGIIAQDIIASLSDVQTTDDILKAADASVWNVYTKTPLNQSIQVLNTLERDRNQIVELKSGGLTAKIKADVFDVYNPTTHEGMNADSFKVVYRELANEPLKDKQIKHESSVEAWNVIANKKVKDNQIAVDLSDITKPGVFDLVMKTQEGTSLTINVEAVDKRIEIQTQSVVLEESKAYQTGESNLMVEGNISAENKLTNTPVQTLSLPNWNTVLSHKLPTGTPIEVDVKAVDGRYEETSSMNVYVFKSLDEAETYALDAHNASSKLDPTQLSDAQLLELVGASVYKISGGIPSKVDENIGVNKTYLNQGILILNYKDLSVTVTIMYQANDESELKPVVPLPDPIEDPDPIKAASTLLADDVHFDLEELKDLISKGLFEEALLQRANIRINGQELKYPIQISKDIFGIVEIKDR